jgi:peroxiredoxin
MKRNLLALSLILFITVFAEAPQTLPNITLKDVNGKNKNVADYAKTGQITVINFWATWCTPCKKELNNYTEYYADWQAKYGVTIYAISIDDSRSVSRVAPYINSVSWDYKVILDSNKQFAQAMGVNNGPHTFLVDKDGKIVWSHNNYAEGDEAELEHQLEK